MICDLAETYHILNYRELSPSLVATLVLGLEDNSRVKRKMSGQKLTLDQMLMCLMVDALNLLLWTKSKDAKQGRNKPKSLLKKLTNKDEYNELQSFDTQEEFEEYMRKINNGSR